MTRRGLFQMVAAAFVASRLPVSQPPEIVGSVEFMARAIRGALETMPPWRFDYGPAKPIELVSLIHHNFDAGADVTARWSSL